MKNVRKQEKIADVALNIFGKSSITYNGWDTLYTCNGNDIEQFYLLQNFENTLHCS